MTNLVRRTLLAVTLACAAIALSLCASSVQAQNQNGTWVQDASGLWSLQSNWLSGIADGATFTADFSTINIVNNDTVTLDSSRSIGKLIFQDKTTASNNWFLTSSGGSVLTLDNGASQPVITALNQTTTISAPLAGTNGVDLTGGNATLILSGANTYTGVTTINSTSGTGTQFTIQLANNSALGASTVNMNPGGSNNARLELNSGVNIPNNITITSQRTLSGGNGTLMTNGDVSATFSGTITINGPDVSGGHFVGAQEAAFNPTTGNFLTFSGPVVSTLASTTKDKAGGNALVARAGNLRFADTTGTSSYFRIEDRAGILQVGATNGIATNAYVDLGGNVNGNPQNYSVLDLNGFNQTLVGISNYIQIAGGLGGNANPVTVTNSSTTTAATLTIAPANPSTNANQANLVFTANSNGAGVSNSITDASASFPLSLVVSGDPAGTQYLTTANDSYRGATTLTSGVLAVSSLTNGGTNSSIGASSNAATNLVFHGGTLEYVNSSLNSTNQVIALANSTTPSTDRNFTINTSGTINVQSATTTLTMTGASTGAGSLIKTGPGTLVLTGANQHLGGTTISAGTLRVTSPGSLSTGNVSIANLATLAGTGTIGGTVTPASGGIISPGVSGVNNGLGTLNVASLALNSGAVLNMEITDTANLDQINIASGATFTGGSIFLFQPGTTNAFQSPAGTNNYPLFTVGGAISGSANNLTIANPQAGKFYSFSGTSTITLTIGDAVTREWNNLTADGLWTTGGNWIGGVPPNSVGQSAKFGTATGGGPVNLNGNETVSGLIFDNGSSYTLTGTASTLTLNNGVAAAAITVNNGSHTISVPVSLSNASSISFANSSAALTISGAISGAKPISVSGTGGTLTLSGNNGYSTTALSGATLNIGTFGGSDTSGTLGNGDVTFSNGATLNFNRGNAYSFAGALTGSGVGAGSVNQLGGGTTTITGAITNVTTVNVAAGTLNASGAIGQVGGVNVTDISGIGTAGTGSFTASGIISGAGSLNVNTTGTVTLNANNTYTGGTAIAGGRVILNSANALPAASSLAVNGGVLDLNGKNISLSNIADTTAGGVITNNGGSGTTSTITFGGAGASYMLFAALNDGASGGKVALTTSIANTQSGNIFILHSNSTSTFSGGTIINSQSIEADATNAFGVGPITVTANNTSTNSSQILLAPGVSLSNNITIAQGNPHPVNGTTSLGVIQPATSNPTSDSTVSGTITILANNINDGLFNGPVLGGTAFLDVTGAVNAAGTATSIVQIGGQVKYAGGGTYPNFLLNGLAQLSATNGLANNAVLQFSTVQAAGTASAGTFDLGGFDQSLVALSATSGTLASTVQNSGAGTNTLTLNTSGTTNFNGAINGSINLIVGGSGTQQLTGVSSYTGLTTMTGTAVLEANTLASGGSPSSIGAATNAATNLVFDGGTLRYTGASSVSIDRGFTINAGKTAKIDVATTGTNLTWTGSSGASTGGLTKLDPGTLTIDAAATHGYTGATTVGGGILAVNNNLTRTSSISIAAGAFLTGSGSIGGTLTHTAGTINPGVIGGASAGTLTFTGPMTLNGGTVQYDVDGSNLGNNAAQDVVNANGGLSIAGPTTIDLEFLNPTSPPTSPFDYLLFNYTGTAVTQAQANNLNYITNIAGRNTYTTSVATAGQVSVHVITGVAANLNWNSTSSGVWDTATANWFNIGTSSQDKFVNGDNVTFPDGAGLQTSIALNTAVSPSSMTVTANTNNYTISGTGKVSGLATLTMSGNGTLRVQTNNDYSGGTTINAGTVNVGGNSGSGSLGTGTITNNASLIFSRTDGNAITPLSFLNSITGTGNLTLSFAGTASMTGSISQASVLSNGAGTANLTNSVSTTGVITVSAGVANFSGSVSPGGGIAVNGTGSMTSSGGISGSAGITVNTTGFATISGSNSYDGNTIISGGTFFPNANTAFGSTVGSTTVNSGGSIFTVQANAYNGEAVTINGTGTMTGGNPNNDGALHAGGAAISTFDGPITVASNSLMNLDGGATLSLTNASALTGSNVTVSLAGPGTLSIGGNVNLGATGAINTGANSVLTFAPPVSTTITMSSPIVGAQPVNIATAGTPTEATMGTTILAANSPALTGPININSGDLVVQAAGELGTGTINISGTGAAGVVTGTLQLAPSSGNLTLAEPITVGARMDIGIDVPHIENVSGNNTLSGAITVGTGGSDYNFASDAGLLTIKSAFSTTGLPTARNLKLQGDGNGIWSGVLSEIAAAPLSLFKSGAGTWTLSGNNTYSGGTTVNAGTLTTTATGSLGSGPLAINAADTVTSVVNLGSNQTVTSLSGTLAGTGSARVNVASGTTLNDTDTAATTYAGSIGLAAGATAHSGGTLTMAGSGTLETQGAPSLGSNSNINVTGSGTLRFNVMTGAASVGTGVVSTVSGTGTLELAGTTSALSSTASAADRVNISNNSTAPGLHVTGIHQQVGGIDGAGTTQVDASSDLTANHIVQSALVIGGAAGSPATVTIAPSDVSGNPLASAGGFVLVGSLASNAQLSSGLGSSSLVAGGGFSSASAANSGGGSGGGVNLGGGAATVPEPSTLLMALFAIASLGYFARRKRE